MSTHTTRKAKVFVVNALLGLPGDEGEWLAEIKTQISQMGRIIQQRDPEKYLQEISNLVVCPVCLKEKPIEWTSTLEYEGETYHSCRCPHCEQQFKKKPEYFIKRLAGVETEYVSN